MHTVPPFPNQKWQELYILALGGGLQSEINSILRWAGRYQTLDSVPHTSVYSITQFIQQYSSFDKEETVARPFVWGHTAMKWWKQASNLGTLALTWMDYTTSSKPRNHSGPQGLQGWQRKCPREPRQPSWRWVTKALFLLRTQDGQKSCWFPFASLLRSI